MKVTPMIFNTQMVEALLDGRKTVTRRPIKIPCGWELGNREMFRITSSHPKKGEWGAMISKGIGTQFPEHNIVPAPCYIGDLIYVRETFVPDPNCDDPSWDNHECSYFEWDGCNLPVSHLPNELKNTESIYYKAGTGDAEMIWKPSIHMPRWASRLTLKITDVRVEKVQDITAEQAVCEGMPTAEEAKQMAIDAGMSWYQKPRTWFKWMWKLLYKDWEENPYVWVIEFEVIHQNVDKYLTENKGK